MIISSSSPPPPRAAGGEDELQDDALGQAGWAGAKERNKVGLAAKMLGNLMFTL